MNYIQYFYKYLAYNLNAKKALKPLSCFKLTFLCFLIKYWYFPSCISFIKYGLFIKFNNAFVFLIQNSQWLIFCMDDLEYLERVKKWLWFSICVSTQQIRETYKPFINTTYCKTLWILLTQCEILVNIIGAFYRYWW